MKQLVGCLFGLGISLVAWAQNGVEITYQPGLKSAIDTYIANVETEKIKGFRVQLFAESGNNARAAANTVKSHFLRLFDQVPAYLVWEQPSFKVRVGDFKNRLDATLFWKQIQVNFPQSYVVTDQINLIRVE